MKNSALLSLSAVALLAMAGCSDSNSSQGDPRRIMAKSRAGYKAPQKVTAAKDFQHLWINQVASGWDRQDFKAHPARIEPIQSVRNCNFQRKKPDDVVRLAHVSYSESITSIHRGASEDIAKAAKHYVRHFQKNKKGQPFFANVNNALTMVDVVVTEKGAPVYLVLVGSHKILWNIHAAEGVKISHIAMIGDDEVAAANIPEGTTVEALYGASRTNCKVVPTRRLADHWGLIREAKQGAFGGEESLKKLKRKHSRFSSWTRKQFGIPASRGAVEMYEVSHVLIGDIPKDASGRAPYKTLAGATVYMTPADHVFVGDSRGYAKKRKELVKDYIQNRLKISLASLGE